MIQRVGRSGRAVVVGEVESGRVVTLAELIGSFLEDPDETRTGPIRIVIEPTSQWSPPAMPGGGGSRP